MKIVRKKNKIIVAFRRGETQLYNHDKRLHHYQINYDFEDEHSEVIR